MLIVNSYPLNNSNQLWSLPSNPDVRFQFPDDASEATFNATLALLGYDDQNRDYSLPFPSNGVPVPGTLHPPIWISVVGRDHLWPVKAQAPGDLLYTYEPSQSSLIKLLPVNRRLWWRGVYPEGSVIFISVFIVLSCFFCVPLLRRPHSSGRWARTWIGAFLAPPLFNKHRLEGELFLLVACSSLAAFLIVTITALTIPAGGIIGQAYPSSAPFAGEQLFAVIVVALLCFLFLALMPRAVFCLFRSIRSGLAKEFISVPGKLSATAWLPMISGCTVVLSLALTFVAKWIWASVMGDFRLALFTSIRYLDFANGVSALVPLLLVSVAGFLWATSSFHRLRMLEGMCHSGSFLSLIVPRFHCIHELETKVERVLHRPSLRLPGSRIVCAVATVSVSYLFLSQLVSSFENCFFYWLFAAAYLGVSLPLWLGVLRFYSVWGQTQHILQQLALTPMRDACKRFRRSFPAWPKVDLAMPAPSLAPIALSIDMLNSIVRRADLLAQTTAAKKGQFSLEVDVDGAEFEAKGKVEKEHLSDFELQALRVLASPEMVHSVDAAEAFLIAAQTADAARADDAGQWRSVLTNQCKAQEYLTGITRMVTNALELHWWKELRSAKKVPESGSSSPNQVFQLCEEFLAGRAAHFFAHVFPQMQNLIYTSVAGLLLMLFAVSSYPFQPHNQLLFFNWIVVLSFVGIALWVFVQMNRNPILSILNGTKPGQITWDREFVFRVFFYAVIPLLALLGAQFPDTVGQILSHLAPAESMH
jgi:hypothetical protein